MIDVESISEDILNVAGIDYCVGRASEKLDLLLKEYKVIKWMLNANPCLLSHIYKYVDITKPKGCILNIPKALLERGYTESLKYLLINHTSKSVSFTNSTLSATVDIEYRVDVNDEGVKIFLMDKDIDVSIVVNGDPISERFLNCFPIGWEIEQLKFKLR